jgi:hypothetical protein
VLGGSTAKVAHRLQHGGKRRRGWIFTPGDG